MLDFEFRVIRSVLEGNHVVFESLRSQLTYLHTVRRTQGRDRYEVEYELTKKEDLLVKGPCANMEISDTCLELHETSSQIFVNVQVLDGYLNWMEIFGKYDFRKPITVKGAYWLARNGDDVRFIYNPLERDYEYAFGYIPTYR